MTPPLRGPSCRSGSHPAAAQGTRQGDDGSCGPVQVRGLRALPGLVVQPPWPDACPANDGGVLGLRPSTPLRRSSHQSCRLLARRPDPDRDHEPSRVAEEPRRIRNAGAVRPVPGHAPGPSLAQPRSPPSTHRLSPLVHPDRAPTCGMLVGIAAGQRRLADATRSIEMDQSRHGATVRGGPSVAAGHTPTSPDPRVLGRFCIDHSPRDLTGPAAGSRRTTRPLGGGEDLPPRGTTCVAPRSRGKARGHTAHQGSGGARRDATPVAGQRNRITPARSAEAGRLTPLPRPAPALSPPELSCSAHGTSRLAARKGETRKNRATCTTFGRGVTRSDNVDELSRTAGSAPSWRRRCRWRHGGVATLVVTDPPLIGPDWSV